MRWDPQIVKEAAAKVPVMGYVQVARNLGVTEDMLRGAIRRHKIKASMLGSTLESFFEELGETKEVEAKAKLKIPRLSVPRDEEQKKKRNIIIPKDVKASDIPPDHGVDADKVESGFVFCTSDHHHPISDKVAEAAMVKLAQDLKPHTFVVNGDVVDAWFISRHDKEADRLFDPDAGPRLKDEIESFRPLGNEIARICKRVYIGEGNHEVRLAKLVNANPALYGLLDWETLFALPENVKFLKYGYRLRLGPVSFVHGDRIGGRFGVKNPTQWMLSNKGNRTVIFGHSHGMSCTYRTVWDDTGQPHGYVAIEQGHLSNTKKQLYVVEPDWTTGFVVVEFFTVAGKTRFTPHLVPIVDGRFSFGGKVYDGRRS